MGYLTKVLVLLGLLVVTLKSFGSEKIIFGRVDWYPINEARKDIQEAGKAVGRLNIPEARSRCTAFFVKPNVVMTAWHCVRNKFWARDVEMVVEDKKYKCDQYIKGNAYWDYTLLQCKKSHTHHFKLKRIEVVNQSQIFIIHVNCDYRFSRCKPRKVVSTDFVKNIWFRSFSYRADTLGGSSGAPVLNKDMEVVGIHTSGLPKESNVGTRLSAIDELPYWVYKN